MNEQMLALVKGLLMPGMEVINIYKSASGTEILVDVDMGGTKMTCSLKKNHAGAFYLE